MPLRDEKVFTDDEMVAAFSILLPPERAREEGVAYNAFPDLQGFEAAFPDELLLSEARGPRSYDGDILDLLSLVSESCAERVWRLQGLSREEGEIRRETFRRRVDEARRSEKRP